MSDAIVECLGEWTQCIKKVSVFTTEDKSALIAHPPFFARDHRATVFTL